MSALPAVRGRIEELRQAGIDVLTLDIHSEPGAALAEALDVSVTPTYLLLGRGGAELLRTNTLVDLSALQTRINPAAAP